jgi:hypothetical protein
MKKFILFAFLLLSTISFASNSIGKIQEKNVTTIEAVSLTSVELQTAVFEIMPGQICITTYYEAYSHSYTDLETGVSYDVYRVYSSTYCG